MSVTREIERNQWGKFLDKVSRQELKHPVHIEVAGEDRGDEQMTSQLPLVGLSLERKGSEAGAIDLIVGRMQDSEMIDHRIARAQRIYAQEDDQGRLECLDIEDADHQKTLVYFD